MIGPEEWVRMRRNAGQPDPGDLFALREGKGRPGCFSGNVPEQDPSSQPQLFLFSLSQPLTELYDCPLHSGPKKRLKRSFEV